MAKNVKHEDIRINKVIGESGFCSRREADQLILDGRVTINGELATLGSRVAEGDKVKIDGEPLYFIPMEMREYKLRRNGFSRRGVSKEEAGEKRRAGHKSTTVNPDKQEKTTRGKKADRVPSGIKSRNRQGSSGRGESPSKGKRVLIKGRKK